MLLEPVGNFNKFSPKLRQEIEDKVKSFGPKVRYLFNVSSLNPDPEKRDGNVIWPSRYTLDPCVWDIADPHEGDSALSKIKRVGIVDAIDDKGIPTRFRKIRISGVSRGVLNLDLDNTDDFVMAMAIEMHPKLEGGKFQKKDLVPIIKRVDETADAKSQKQLREAKRKALQKAQDFTDEEVYQFVDAMMWDRAQDMIVLRNQIEAMAEDDHDFFNKFTEGKSVKYQAAVKRAIDLNYISYNDTEDKFVYSSNGSAIITLTAKEGKTHIERFADWLENGGEKAGTVFTNIEKLLSGSKK